MSFERVNPLKTTSQILFENLWLKKESKMPSESSIIIIINYGTIRIR